MNYGPSYTKYYEHIDAKRGFWIQMCTFLNPSKNVDFYLNIDYNVY